MDDEWKSLASLDDEGLAKALSLAARVHFIIARSGCSEETIATFIEHFDNEAAELKRMNAVYGTSKARTLGLNDVIYLGRLIQERRTHERQNLAGEDFANAGAATDRIAVSLGNFLSDQITDPQGPSTLETLALKLRGTEQPSDQGGLLSRHGVVWLGFCICFLRYKRLPTRREHREQVFKDFQFTEGSSARRNFAIFRNELGLKGLPGPD